MDIDPVKKSAKKAASPNGTTLDAYFGSIKNYKLLDYDTLVELFKTYEKGGAEAEKAKKRLIECNLRLVVSIAKWYKGNHNIPLEDLIQEGNIGLIKAIERFDYKKGFKFSTYARWWIKQAVSQYVLKRRRMIRLPAHAAGLQRKMLQTAQEHHETTGETLSQEDLFEITGGSEEVMRAAMSSGRLVVSLNQTMGSNPDSNTLEETIEDDSHYNDPFNLASDGEMIGIIKRVITQLSPKESTILKLRFGLFDDLADTDDFTLKPGDMEQLHAGNGLS